jgi:hypothetical protein
MRVVTLEEHFTVPAVVQRIDPNAMNPRGGRSGKPPTGAQHTRTPAPAERLASGWQYVGAGNGLSAIVSANACRHGITRRVKIFFGFVASGAYTQPPVLLSWNSWERTGLAVTQGRRS